MLDLLHVPLSALCLCLVCNVSAFPVRACACVRISVCFLCDRCLALCLHIQAYVRPCLRQGVRVVFIFRRKRLCERDGLLSSFCPRSLRCQPTGAIPCPLSVSVDNHSVPFGLLSSVFLALCFWLVCQTRAFKAIFHSHRRSVSRFAPSVYSHHRSVFRFSVPLSILTPILTPAVSHSRSCRLRLAGGHGQGLQACA